MIYDVLIGVGGVVLLSVLFVAAMKLLLKVEDGRMPCPPDEFTTMNESD